jgi:predicted nucleic acid-binding protein
VKPRRAARASAPSKPASGASANAPGTANPSAAAPATLLTGREPTGRWLAQQPPHTGPVLVDSGPLIALFNGADRWHAPARDWLRHNPGATLLSTWPVATEVCALLARRIANAAALDFLRWAQRGGLTLHGPEDGTLTEVLRLSERFADLPFDLADASIAELAARLKLRHLISIDADLDVYRHRAGRPLVNLLRA